MSQFMVGTCQAGMPTTALVPHSIGATISLCATYQLNHFLCITEVVPIPLLGKCPNFLTGEGTLFNTADASLSALKSARGQAVVHAWFMLFMRASVRCPTG